ncbi:hypothetical protein [Gemmata sp.]|uniref:hypothetical protein n=1 Tax=Gemmata sp. TaxID=1914242 RepID=UPI003F70C61A
MPDTAPKKSPATVANPTGWDRPVSEINATIRKAESGNAAALDEVKLLLARPGTADLFGGNVAREAVRKLVTTYAGKNPAVRESILRKLEELRAEVSGPNPSPLEKLLVERVVATWLHLHHLEAVYAGKESMSLPLGAYYQKSISAAQKRYIAAIKGLAEVRKLAIPVLQVNIAKKQLNVAAGNIAAGSVSN